MTNVAASVLSGPTLEIMVINVLVEDGLAENVGRQLECKFPGSRIETFSSNLVLYCCTSQANIVAEINSMKGVKFAFQGYNL